MTTPETAEAVNLSLGIGDALLVFGITTIGTVISNWAVTKWKLRKHEEQLEEGKETFKELFQKLTEAQKEISTETDQKIKKHSEYCEKICLSKHGEHDLTVSGIEKTLKDKVSVSEKCMHDIKHSLGRLETRVEESGKTVFKRLEAHDEALKDIPELMQQAMKSALHSTLVEFERERRNEG